MSLNFQENPKFLLYVLGEISLMYLELSIILLFLAS